MVCKHDSKSTCDECGYDPPLQPEPPPSPDEIMRSHSFDKPPIVLALVGTTDGRLWALKTDGTLWAREPGPLNETIWTKVPTP